MAGWLCEGKNAGAGCSELVVQPALGNTMVIGFMVHFGFSLAGGTHLGNLLGAGDHRRARATAITSFSLAAILATSAAALLYTFRAAWTSSFVPEGDIEASQLMQRCLGAVCTYIIFDAMGIGSLNGILRATGRMLAPGLANFGSFYALGLPLAYYLSFVRPEWELGLFGLWSGLNVGMVVMCGFLAWLACRLDWEVEAAAAVARSAGGAAGDGVGDGGDGGGGKDAAAGGEESEEKERMLASAE
eukprot:SAG22_NODE_1667_length_3851_cov_1.673774_4_plen_245_part_00